MHTILTSVLIAIAANLDNLGVGIAYGIQKIRISYYANFIIAIISFLATFLSAVIGEIISYYLSKQLASIIGAILLLGVGAWIFIQPIIPTAKNKPITINVQLCQRKSYIAPTEILRCPKHADIDNSHDIGTWEAIILGIALSINALAGGFDAGSVGISSLVEAILVGTFSFLTIIIGCHFGKRYVANQLGKYATLVSGVLLIIIGLDQLIQ